ncbi:MAG: helix-turn-helix domain-containing protein [Methanimicrococcus sp.]|nr:helix-turn-helix domain-containing protein [Methanimicrococcus sp.]
MDSSLVNNLKKFGLSENEAKAYIGLVFLHEPSVRALHEFTKIPRAKLYEVLENLVEKKYAGILHGTPIHYKPTEPDDLVQMLREDYEKTADEISKSFDEMELDLFMEESDDFVSIQYLRSDWAVRKKLNEIFDNTKKNLIILSRSPEVLKELESDLVEVGQKLNILILADNLKGYENFSLPVTLYPKNVRSVLKELEESHLVNQSTTIISDSGRALAIRKTDAKTEAHYISQPIVIFLYKTIFYFVHHADDVQLPPELMD